MLNILNVGYNQSCFCVLCCSPTLLLRKCHQFIKLIVGKKLQNDQIYLQFLTIGSTVFLVIMIIPGNIINKTYGIRMSIMIVFKVVPQLLQIVYCNFYQCFFLLFLYWILIFLIGFPFRLINGSKFVANWFFSENRILIMVIIALVFNASSGKSIRILLIVLVDFQIHDHPIDEQIELGRALIESLMFLLFEFMILLCVPPILFFLSKPVTPPKQASHSSQEDSIFQKSVENLQYLRNCTIWNAHSSPACKKKVFFFIVYFFLCGSHLLNYFQGIPEILILKGDHKLCSTLALILMLILICSSTFLTMKINENLKRSEQDIQLDDRIEKKITEVTLLDQQNFNVNNDDY